MRFPRYLAVACGVFCGLGLYLVYASNALSYMSDDPKACVNCHIMGAYYASHAHSSHKNVATCNDCHVPHDSVVAKYLFKAKDGLYHSTVFTLRGEPQAMRIKEAGTDVVQANCLRCHGQMNAEVAPAKMTLAMKEHGAGKLCWDCHREMPHGTVRSISSSPAALVPYPESQTPAWLKKITGENPARTSPEK